MKTVIIMQATLIAAVAACFAIMVLMSPKPAMSLPAGAALHPAAPGNSIVHEAKKYRYGYRRGRPYYRGYAYRPYYLPYYRPYGYYGYGYPYWRRPGFSIWFGF